MDGPRCVSHYDITKNDIANFPVAIHGDKQQNERDWVLNEFKTGKSPIMVATDVASRGIGMIEKIPAPIASPPTCRPVYTYFLSDMPCHLCVI
jgi:ATP-dependent RNA helicase DDX5/DBP2